MNFKLIIIGICCVFITVPAQAQLLKKLKQKAQDAAERTILRKTDEVVTKKTEKTIDDVTSPSGDNNEGVSQKGSENQITSGNTALEKNADAKKAFYKEDVVIKLHENGKLNQTQYFDVDEVAVKMEGATLPKPGYADSEGFMYGYNESVGEYQKSSLVSLQSQGMMVPTMMLEAYKLPPEPFMHNLQLQQNQGLTPNPFNGIVEFAFVYEPEQFRYEDFKESKQKVSGKTYTRFDFLNEPGYEGSYVMFDDQNRLVEIYTNKQDTGQPMDITQMSMTPPGESLLQYEYKPVSVKLPPAREVKAQGQGMMEMVMGSFNKPKNPDDFDDEYDTQGSKGQVKSVRNSLKNNKTTINDLPESYDFDWKYETEMVMESRKKDLINMTFLIKKGATYQATQMVDSKSKDMGNMTMLFDSNLNSMIMFMEGQGQKFLQIYPIPEARESNTDLDYKITQLAPKTILGYSCKGLQMEDDKYIIKVYHATGTPITLSNFMNFNGNNKIDLPDIDPKITSQFSNGLIMEMEMIDKKKSKNNMLITAKSLTKESLSITKNDYKSMNLMGGMNTFGK